MQTARSASRTWSASRSAVEKTATASIPELPEGADHPDGDLAAVRDQDAREHGQRSGGRPLSGSSSNSS